MKRILCTTAIVAGLAGTAFADAHKNSEDKDMDHQVKMEQKSSEFGDVQAQQTDFFASDLIGMRIYSTENDYEMDSTVAANTNTEWDDIGEINDILVSKDGNIRGVILGVGGFLGLGEHDVAVSMDTIKVVREDDDPTERFLVVKTSKEALEATPAFDREAMEMDGYTGIERREAMANTEMDEEVERAGAATLRETDAEVERDYNTAEIENDIEQAGDELQQDANAAMNEVEQEATELSNEANAQIEETEQDIENAAENADAELEDEDVDTSSLETERETSDG